MWNASLTGQRCGLEIQWLRSGCTFDLAEEWDRAVTEVFAAVHDHGEVGASQ